LHIRSPKEKESSPPHIEDVMTNSKEKIENTLPPFQGYAATNLKNMILMPTPQSVVGSNELNNSPMEPSLTQYIQSKVYRHL